MLRIFFILLVVSILSSCQKVQFDLIIRNAQVVDGSGGVSFTADVAVQADTIAAIGNLSNAKGLIEIDADGLVLSPGFIDTHSHHERGMMEGRDLLALTTQGVTTMIVGQDGSSHFPLASFFQQIEASPVAINIGSYTGHNTLRDSVIEGDFQRHCTEVEVEKMKDMLRQDMQAGSMGLSTGLEYDPGIFSSEEEVLALAQVAAQYQGRYISHLRSEDRYFWKALKEIINIGKEANMPVQISHAKLAMRSLWGQSGKMLSILDSARAAGILITADVYPYTYWQSTMAVLFPERNFSDRKMAEFALSELTTPEGLRINTYTPHPEYVGKNLAQVATERKTDAPQALMDLLTIAERENGDESIIAVSMTEEDIATLLKWPFANVCSDGSSTGLHPRGHGSFTKILRQYVREQKILSLEQAIYKMTGRASLNLNLYRRGFIKEGYFADLVLFDPSTVSDQATPENPLALSSGVAKVWVNGVEILNGNAPSHQYPGVILKRK